jgi:murein DD-endopeptidase MepM/ murein hydrolase activator NlpD
MALAVRLAVIGLAVLAGWVLACVFPPPDALIEKINPRFVEQRVRSLRENVVNAAVSAGQLIMVERVSAEDISNVTDMPDWIAAAAGRRTQPTAPAGASVPASASASAALPFETSLSLCPGMTISNAPRASADRQVANYAPLASVNGVSLAVNPTRGACLASGFGPRGERVHRGVDYHSPVGGEILAAADGTIIEMKYRDDYGNMLLIDHGGGVYTRYAHLSTFHTGLAVGGRVNAGDVIGLMGNTASYPIPIHLHYEVLIGDYNNPRASFGLEAANPFGHAVAQGG